MTAEEKLQDMFRQEDESKCIIGNHIRPSDMDLIADLVVERLKAEGKEV